MYYVRVYNLLFHHIIILVIVAEVSCVIIAPLLCANRVEYVRYFKELKKTIFLFSRLFIAKAELNLKLCYSECIDAPLKLMPFGRL